MIRRPPRSTLSSSSAASDVYKRQEYGGSRLLTCSKPALGCGAVLMSVSRWTAALLTLAVVSVFFKVFLVSEGSSLWLRRGSGFPTVELRSITNERDELRQQVKEFSALKLKMELLQLKNKKALHSAEQSPDEAPVRRGDQQYSSHHCVGQMFGGKEDAAASSCEFRNICLNPSVGTFQYFSPNPENMYELHRLTRSEHVSDTLLPPGIKPGDADNSSKHRAARGFLKPDMRVSMMPHSRFHQGTRSGPFQAWMPEIVGGPIPEDAMYDPARVAVLMAQYNGHNFGHLLYDEVLPWFTLLDMFGYGHVTDSVLLENENFNWKYPHHVSPEEMKTWKYIPPQNTCAKFKRSNDTGIAYNDNHDGDLQFDGDTPVQSPADQMDDEEKENMENVLKVCDKLVKRAVPLMSRRPRREFPAQAMGASAGAPLLCFDTVLAGVGLLTEHCTDNSAHGDMPDTIEEQPTYCNAGRGGHFWRFRVHTLKMIGAMDKPCVRGKPLQVLWSIRASSTFDRFEGDAERNWFSHARKFKSKLGIVKTHKAKELSMLEQVQDTADSAVMVTLGGGGASHALWLPRGGTLIIVSPIDLKDDFVLWAHLSHVTVRWVEVGWISSSLDPLADQIAALVEEGLQRYSSMRC
eukprot:TRINITY_DN632_c0_g1_i4.p1 TRINITY_DN632_c0_g1~~TRINITY_DN632_c0_g1_i4.p1  ORF type:complete len:634 (+),score=105.01 TRINITY_DN632_c0_g1_i4:91-1992(+)